MRRGRGHIRFTPGFCICLALCFCILPLKWVASWFLAIGFHEFCHYISVRLCGAPVQEVSFTAGGIRMRAELDHPWQQILCSLAGPLGSFFLLFLRRYIPICALCGLIHGMYNLLPLENLDGGRAVFALLCMMFDYDRANIIFAVINKMMAMIAVLIMIYLSWYLRWIALAAVAGIFLLKNRGCLKSTCKHGWLRVQ